jgi:sensor histidine kinase YesM
MEKKKIIILTTSFLLALIGIRFLWASLYYDKDHPQAEGGVLDLRGVDITEDPVQLVGEWMFSPWSIEKAKSLDNTPTAYITVPGKWRESLINPPADSDMSFLYGTYHLRILVDEDVKSEPYALYVKDIRSASTIFINGEKVMEQGIVATRESDYVPNVKPFKVEMDSNVNVIDVTIQVADTGPSKKSGMQKPIQFGFVSAVEKSHTVALMSQILSVSILLLHFVFAVIIYIGFSRRSELLYLAIAFGCSAISILLDDERILLYLFPTIEQFWWMKLAHFSYATSIIFLALFFKKLLDGTLKATSLLSNLYKLLVLVYLLYIFALLLDIRPVSGNLFSLIFFVGPILIPFSLLKIVSNGTRGSIYLLFATVSIAFNVVCAYFSTIGLIVLPYYPFNMIIAVICFAVFWFKQFFQATEESKALSERLLRVNQKKDEFLANTSHELRNPLHGIMNISQTIYETESDHLSADSKRNMETLISVSKRMSYILNDLFDIQRLKEGGIQLHKVDVDLTAVISSVVDMMRLMTEGKDIAFTIDISDDFPYVRADENRLFQIMFNLIHNAVKYSEHGEITISAGIEGEMAKISVKDTGIGMDEETLKSIFLPYEQADSSMTAMGGGLGLGLSICEHLVSLHGGQLDVQSAVAEGSTFSFTIPVGDERKDLRTERPVLHSSKADQLEVAGGLETAGMPRVLVVDDDSLNLTIVQRILKAAGFEVTTCTSGLEALEVLNKGKWDLVLTDIMMPKMSGYELTKKIRERYTMAELPIMMLTARSQMEDIQTGFSYGANDYIIKPVDKAELVVRVKALTDLGKAMSDRVIMEAAWLHAQIQPHFLFNTLNTIAALSDEEPEKMIKLIHEFGNYLNASFTTQNLSELVLLEKELDLVRSYVFIEKERFGERLQVEWQVNVNSKVLVPPLAIQTLVENAINHGVLRLPDGGTVIISITEQEGFVEISIADDGIGIEQEKARKLLSDVGERNNGIGLLNTDKRLHQLFGKGLTIMSEHGVGTTVSFQVPV